MDDIHIAPSSGGNVRPSVRAPTPPPEKPHIFAFNKSPTQDGNDYGRSTGNISSSSGGSMDKNLGDGLKKSGLFTSLQANKSLLIIVVIVVVLLIIASFFIVKNTGYIKRKIMGGSAPPGNNVPDPHKAITAPPLSREDLTAKQEKSQDKGQDKSPPGKQSELERIKAERMRLKQKMMDTDGPIQQAPTPQHQQSHQQQAPNQQQSQQHHQHPVISTIASQQQQRPQPKTRVDQLRNEARPPQQQQQQQRPPQPLNMKDPNVIGRGDFGPIQVDGITMDNMDRIESTLVTGFIMMSQQPPEVIDENPDGDDGNMENRVVEINETPESNNMREPTTLQSESSLIEELSSEFEQKLRQLDTATPPVAASSPTCSAITAMGGQCRRQPLRGGLCGIHAKLKNI